MLCKQLQRERHWDDVLWFFAYMRRMVVESSSPRMLHLMKQYEARAAAGGSGVVGAAGANQAGRLVVEDGGLLPVLGAFND